MDFLLHFEDSNSDNSHLLRLQHAALQYMTLKKLFEYIREKCGDYQQLQVSGCGIFVR